MTTTIPYPPCDGKYRATHDSGTRQASQIRYVVLHSTESGPGSAESIARYFTTSGSGGSAHLVIDDDHCFRTLPDLVVPWGAPPLNTSGYHIEHCGYARWTRAEWELHRRMLDRSAYKASIRCHRYHIPARLLTDRELKAGRLKGFVTHAQVSRVYKRTDHSDPGDGFPLKAYISAVAAYLENA